jgi:hypothetical protein
MRSNGSTDLWTPQVVGTASISGALAPAKLMRYMPPQSGTWSSVRMDEYTGGHAAVLSISGIPWMADKLAKGNEITKQQIKNQMNDKALSKAPEKKTLLEANTAYEIHVECQWQGWKKADDGKQQPDPPAEGAWQDFPQPAVYSFQTAAAAVPQAPLPPVDFKNETAFDPRGIARYIIGVRPDGNGTPHFLDDPVYVDFAIDHIEQLLAAYGRELLLKVRRTDQGVNAVPGFGTPPDINSTKTIVPLPHHLKSKADQYFLESFANAPCMEAPDIGGQSIELTADLQPNAEYDLLLVAAPANNPNADEVLVYRSHFRTSRYRNPGEMLKAIGFLEPQRPNPVLPHDAILEVTSISLSPSTKNDADFDAALRTLKLDPWPLSPDPRAVVLWQQNGSGYQLAGVMLEHNEPMVRDGRMDLAGVNLQVGNTTVKQALVLKRSNAAGTRALLLPAAPLTVGADDRLELTFADNNSQMKAYRFVHTTPRMVYEEVI